MVLQTNSPKEANEMNAKIRTAIITLIAAASLGSAAMAPVAAQAQPVKQGDLEGKSYTCEHASDNLTVCTDSGGHEWYCEESSDECGQVKLQVVDNKLLHTLTGLKVKSVPLVPGHPRVTVKVAPRAKALR
jgi:hypothetical protein